MHTKFFLENLKGRDDSEDVSLYRKVILEWILGNNIGRFGLDASGSR
jgi:hypothetical protein